LNKPVSQRTQEAARAYFAQRYPDLSDADMLSLIGQREAQTARFFAVYAEDQKKRIDANRELFGQPVYLVDVHAHSRYSDGTAASIAEISDWASKFGLHLQAVTDHETLEQRRETQNYDNLCFGMETTAEGQHIVVLDIQTPLPSHQRNGTMAEKCTEIRKVGAVPIVAHPCGWRTTIYAPDRVDKVARLDGRFGMEIANAAVNLFDYYDLTDERAVGLWDRLLRMGKRVVGCGSTDAHNVLELGMVWNGLLGRKPGRSRIGARMLRGRHFISNGPFIDLVVDDAKMGQDYRPKRPSVTIRVAAVDVAGIAKVRLLRNGRSMKTKGSMAARDTATLHVRDRVAQGETYYRAEVLSRDGRRAYTNPVWVRR